MKLIIAVIVSLIFTLGVVLVGDKVFNYDTKIMAGWWGCLLYTYMSEARYRKSC